MPEDTTAIHLPGRVLLPDGTEHGCRALFDATGGTEIGLDAPLRPGMRLMCGIDGLGFLDGLAAERTPFGWRLDVRASASHMSRLAARLAWHRRRSAGHVDQRGHDRIVPLSTAVPVRSVSGVTTEGMLIDLSATGAALRLTDRPGLGTRIVVGRRHATVIRILDDGVAVRFVHPLRPQDVGPDTVL